MTSPARLLFDAAVRAQSAEYAAWHTSTEAHRLLTACADVSGIWYFTLRNAMSERITTDLLRRLSDIARTDLGQHKDARQFIVRTKSVSRYGYGETRCSPVSIPTPLLDLVERHLSRFENSQTSTFESKQAEFRDAMRAALPQIAAAYSEEFVDSVSEMLRQADEAATAKGGAA